MPISHSMIATRYLFIEVTLVTWKVNSMVSGGELLFTLRGKSYMDRIACLLLSILERV